MAGYLRKYVGTWRVMADYDQSSFDWIRLDDGTLDPSFDDYYLKCSGNIKIRHGTGQTMSCYIPSIGKGNNILRKIYSDKYKINDDELPLVDIIRKKLVKDQILLSIEELDDEVYFTFKVDIIDYIAKIVGVKTSGANINPLSSKNLPKAKYTIPDKDMKVYKELVDRLPKVTRQFQGKELVMVDGMILNQLIKKFDRTIQKVKGRDFDVNADRKKSCLKSINYIHSLGKEVWDKFIEYLNSEILDINISKME